MKVLHVATRYGRGGSERDIHHWMGCELRRGHEVHFVSGAETDLASLPPGVRCTVLPSLVRDISPSSDAAAFSALRRMVSCGSYDVVHTHQSKAGVLGRMAARGRVRRIVHTVHMPSFGPGYGLLRSRAYLSAERYCGRFTTGYACVGENVRQRYIASGVAPGDRFFIVRTPIELAPFLSTRDARPEDKARYRAQLGLPLGPALAVSIGALEPRKRHALLLRCLAPLLRSGALHLAIAGIGPEERRLRDTADELGVGDHVQFAGYLTQPDRLLAAADVVVHASRAEGVCRVFVEAAASGTPVVSTDVEGALEVPGVTVVSRDGTGLGAAVQRVLGRTCAVDVSELLPWTSSAVEQQFDSFQKRVAVHE